MKLFSGENAPNGAFYFGIRELHYAPRKKKCIFAVKKSKVTDFLKE